MVTSGPGATNIVTPVAGAWIESLPLLIISGQVKAFYDRNKSRIDNLESNFSCKIIP